MNLHTAFAAPRGPPSSSERGRSSGHGEPPRARACRSSDARVRARVRSQRPSGHRAPLSGGAGGQGASDEDDEGPQAHGSIERRSTATSRVSQRTRPVEQGPEVGGPAEAFAGCELRLANGARRRGDCNDERARSVVTRGGCRRGKSFEGCGAIGKGARECARADPLVGTARVSRGSQCGLDHTGGRETQASRQRGEPHGWMQGAIDLRGIEWSKPSKSRGTARAERARGVAASGRRARHLGAVPGSGHSVFFLAEGRSLETPREEVRTAPARTEASVSVRAGEERTAQDRNASSKERRRSRGPCEWIFTDSLSAPESGEPRRPVSNHQGHGGRVGEADDPRCSRPSVKPRCDLGRSGDDAGGPEDPVNSRKAR